MRPSFFLPAVFVACLAQGAVGSVVLAEETPGIRFDLMPVGCLMHTRYGSGEERIEVYVGQRGKTHITQSFANATAARTLSKVVNTITYDALVRMIRKDWAGGKWETFIPFSCFNIPGDCNYRYRNADGDNKTYLGKVVRRGAAYVSSGGFKGEATFAPNTFTYGPFNDIATFREGYTTFKVTQYENCGIGT